LEEKWQIPASAVDFGREGFIFAGQLNYICWEKDMTKFAKITAVLVAVVALGACSTGNAQKESVVHGDSTFERAQTK